MAQLRATSTTATTCLQSNCIGQVQEQMGYRLLTCEVTSVEYSCPRLPDTLACSKRRVLSDRRAVTAPWCA